MKPSPEARDLLGYTWREKMDRWIIRNWWWIAPALILVLYAVAAHFDQQDRDASTYDRINRLQATIDSQRLAAEYRQPAYFIIEAKSPTEAAAKLMAVATQADIQRIHAYNERDRRREEIK